MSIYGTIDYGQDDNQDPNQPATRRQAQPGADGHVDSNPSPVMGNATPEEAPFMANPRRGAPAQPQAGGQVDFNPSPDMGGERNHQVWLLEDDPGIAREDDPNYRLVKPAPGAPQGPNALIEHYIEQGITALSNNDRVVCAQMLGAAKTLISMGMVQAKKANDASRIQKMDDYTATVGKVESSLNSPAV